MKSFWFNQVGSVALRKYIWLALAFLVLTGWLVYSNLMLSIDFRDLVFSSLLTKSSASRLDYQVTTYGPGPKVTRVVIDPQKVTVGQTQTLFLEANDSNSIKSVIAKTVLDNNISKELELNLTSGTSNKGTWSVSWQVHDTHEKEYQTIFKVTNNKGEITKVAFNWLDPTCQPPDYVGNWTMSGAVTCADSAIMGVTGDITVSSGTTLSLANTTLAYEPGKKITIASGASIAISSGGGIQKGYLYVKDDDGDGFFPALDSTHNDISDITTIFSDPGSNGHYTSGGVEYTRYSQLSNVNYNIGATTNSRTALDCSDNDDAYFLGPNAKNYKVHPYSSDCAPYYCGWHSSPYYSSLGVLGSSSGFDYNCDSLLTMYPSDLTLFSNLGSQTSNAPANLKCGYDAVNKSCSYPNYAIGWVGTKPDGSCGSQGYYYTRNSGACDGYYPNGEGGTVCPNQSAVRFFTMSCR